MLNTCILQGRLTADPELRHTSTNVPVTTFRIAVDRDFKDADGNREADFLPVVCWRNTAEFVARNFTKGRLIVVKGRVQVREFTDKEGARKTITEVMADNVYFGDSKKEKDPFYPIDDDDEGLPFD